MIFLTKVKYLLSSLRKQVVREGFSCPSCGHPESRKVDQKMMVTALRRCLNCRLLFRTPTTSDEENRRFYQREYTENFTMVPDRQQLEDLLETSFVVSHGRNYNISHYINILNAFGHKTGNRLLDFGCSWGYNSWQLQKAGYQVQGYDISKARSAYAREHLGVDVVCSLEKIQGPFDIFFCVNVIEHVPSVSGMIALAWSVLKPGGLFLTMTCNGSDESRRIDPERWRKWWGHVHPQLLDDAFYERTFSSHCYLLASNPYDMEAIRSWDGTSSRKLDVGGPELLIAVRRD